MCAWLISGLRMYVVKNVPRTARHYLILQVLDVVWIEIQKSNTKPFLTKPYYRPANLSANAFFINSRTLFIAQTEDLIITISLNCCLLPVKLDLHKKILIDIFDICQLQNPIKKPTRIDSNTETVIDLIIAKFKI